MSVESGYQRGGPTAPAPKPKEVCKNEKTGETCREGEDYCRCGTLE